MGDHVRGRDGSRLPTFAYGRLGILFIGFEAYCRPHERVLRGPFTMANKSEAVGRFNFRQPPDIVCHFQLMHVAWR